MKLECHSGAEGVIAEPGKADSSCNAVFPKLGQIPEANKDLVLTAPDTHGSPALSTDARRLRRAQGTGGRLRLELLLEGVGRPTQLRLRPATDCRFALGDTPEHRSNGTWSDGVPVVPLKIQKSAPHSALTPQYGPAR